MTSYLTDIDPEALCLGRSISADDVVFELKESRLRQFGEVWSHVILPEAALSAAQLLDNVSKAHSSTTFCKIIGVCRSNGALQFVLPHYETLLSSMIAGGALSVERGLRCALDVCRCVQELHECNIHCGVLRPADVLVAGTGACTINTCSVLANSLCGSVFTHHSYFTYMAPEVIMCKFFVNGMKADVWSLACCICRMFDSDSPWPISSSAHDYCRKVHSSPPTLPSCLPSCLVDLIRQCFSLSMPERPSVKEVLLGLEAALSALPQGPVDDSPQQVSQGAVEQASCAQVAENSGEKELAAARSKVKQLECKLHELVLRSNEREEQQQKRLQAAEKDFAALQQTHALLQARFRSLSQVKPDNIAPPVPALITSGTGDVPVPMEASGAPPASPMKPCGTPRRPRTRKPIAPLAGDVKDTIKELDQLTSGSSASAERPTKRIKTEGAVADTLKADASPTGRVIGTRRSMQSLALQPDVCMDARGGLVAHAGSPMKGATVKLEHKLGLQHLGGLSVAHAGEQEPHLTRGSGSYAGVQPGGVKEPLAQEPPPPIPPSALPTHHHGTRSVRASLQAGMRGLTRRDNAAAAVAATAAAVKLGTPETANLVSSEAAKLVSPEVATKRESLGEEGSGALHSTPGAKTGAAALLELARGAGGREKGTEKIGSRLPGCREAKPGSEQSASSSSLTRREPSSPRAVTQPLPPAIRAPPPNPADPPHLTPLTTEAEPSTLALPATQPAPAAGVAAPSSNSASISTTANVDGAGPSTAELQQPAQHQHQQQDATSADCLLTDPKMLIVLVSMTNARTPLREDTGPAGVLGLIMFCLNKAVAASTSKNQQGLKARLLHRSKQVLSQMANVGWVTKNEDGRYILEDGNPAVQAALESASEDEQRRANEAFAMWCRKTFVDEVADSRIINQNRCDLLINNTPHYLAWLAVITKLGPPQGLNEGAINLLHDTVMCYHCPDIARSEEFMTACQALADYLNSAEKKGDKAMLLRKIFTCMAAGYLNRSMAHKAEEMAGKAIVAQPKSPDLESAYWIQGAARYNLGQFSDAEESFQKALKHYQNKVAGGMHHMRTLDFLADVRARQGKWREARKTYQQEVQVGQSRVGGGMHAEQEKAHASHARLLMAMGLFSEADSELQEALAVLERAGTPSSSSAEYCELRAVALAEQYKVQEAAKCLEKAEEIRRGLQTDDTTPDRAPTAPRLSGGSKDLAEGQEPVNVAPTTLVNMAKVSMMNGKYEETEDFCDEIIGLDLEGADDEAAAQQLQGQLFVMQHRFKEAKAKLLQAQELLADSSDMDKLAMLHYWLAQALSHLPGEETAAEEVLTQHMQALEEKWPASSLPGGAGEYLNPRLECLLGQLQAARGSVNDDSTIKTEGLQRCKAGVEAGVKVWGKHHPYFASCLRHVAWAQMACFNYEAALVTLAEERKVWQAMEGGREGLEYAGLAHARAHCHYALQRYSDAERLYRAAAGIFQKVYPKSSLHKWSMVGALAALQDNPSAARTPHTPVVKEVCDVVGCNERKLLQWLDRHRQYWNPAGRR